MGQFSGTRVRCQVPVIAPFARTPDQGFVRRWTQMGWVEPDVGGPIMVDSCLLSNQKRALAPPPPKRPPPAVELEEDDPPPDRGAVTKPPPPRAAPAASMRMGAIK